MTPDKPVCKDIETARRLIAQMKGDYDGRRHSSLDVKPQSPRYDVPEVGQPEKKQGIPRLLPFQEDFLRFAEMGARILFGGGSAERREHTATERQMRSLGRFFGGHIRERFDDCSVGDAVPEENMPGWVLQYQTRGVVRVAQRNTAPWHMSPEFVPSWCFERMIIPLTADNGRTFKDHYFWRRTE